MKTVLYIAGVIGWGIVVFGATFYLSFPSRAVADRIAYEAQERANLAVVVEKPKPKGIGGVKFRSLELGQIRGDQPPKPFLSMGRTWIKVKPLAALRGKYDIRFARLSLG